MKKYFLALISFCFLFTLFAKDKTNYDEFVKTANFQDFETEIKSNPKILKAKFASGENILLCSIRNNKAENIISFLLSRNVKITETNSNKQDALIYVCLYSKNNPGVANLIINRSGNKTALAKALQKKDKFKKSALDYVKETANSTVYDILTKKVEAKIIQKYRPTGEIENDATLDAIDATNENDATKNSDVADGNENAEYSDSDSEEEQEEYEEDVRKVSFEEFSQKASFSEWANEIKANPKILKTKIGDKKENILLASIRNKQFASIISLLLTKKVKVTDTNTKKQDALIYTCIYSNRRPKSAQLVINRYSGKSKLTKALKRKDKYKMCALDYMKANENWTVYDILTGKISPKLLEKYKVTRPEVIENESEEEEKEVVEIPSAPEPEMPEAETAEEIPEPEVIPEPVVEAEPEVPPSEEVSQYDKIYLYDYAPTDSEVEASGGDDDFSKLKNPNAKDAHGRTLLMRAAKDGNDWEVKSLLKAGADINLVDLDGWNAVMFAVRYQNNLEVVKILIENNANLTQANKFGLNALQIAAGYSNNPEILGLLLENYNDAPNMIFKAFVMAIKSNSSNDATQTAKIRTFIEKNVPLNRFYEGKTPLMYAAEFSSSTKVLKLLIDNGAVVTMRDAKGKTAFSYAAENTKLSHDDIYWSLNSN